MEFIYAEYDCEGDYPIMVPNTPEEWKEYDLQIKQSSQQLISAYQRAAETIKTLPSLFAAGLLLISAANMIPPKISLDTKVEGLIAGIMPVEIKLTEDKNGKLIDN